MHGKRRWHNVFRLALAGVACLFLSIFPSLQRLSATTPVTHYVWCGATGGGTGADWTNAFTQLPSSLVRGDTYVIAGDTGCSYDYHLFSDAESGTTVITIRKADATDDSGILGWQPSLATSQAQFCGTITNGSCWQFTDGYYVIDGETGDFSTIVPTNSSATTNYGFLFRSSQIFSNSVILLGAGGSDDCSGMTFRHFEINNVNASNTLGSNGISNLGCTVNNLTLAYAYIHEVGGNDLHSNGWSGATVDHVFCYRNNSSSSIHGELWSDAGGSNVVISNSFFIDSVGTGIIVSRGVGLNFTIYGNVFAFDGNQLGGFGNGAITDLSSSGSCWNNLKVYNNTFYNLTDSLGTHGWVQFMPGDCGTSTADVEDNLWYNSSFDWAPISNTGTLTHDYNTILWLSGGSCSFSNPNNAHDYCLASGATDPTVNGANYNYRLSSETVDPHLNDGVTLSSPYNVDFDGNTRGADGTWERGAYEFTGGVALRPNAPTNLRVTSVN